MFRALETSNAFIVVHRFGCTILAYHKKPRTLQINSKSKKLFIVYWHSRYWRLRIRRHNYWDQELFPHQFSFGIMKKKKNHLKTVITFDLC
jgi:hypothetical protein